MTPMNIMNSMLRASVFAALGLLAAQESIAQAYMALNVTTEGPTANAECPYINNNGTVVCKERTYARLDPGTPALFEDRITFDNPFFSSAGRDAPTISGFPTSTGVALSAINTGSVVTGQLIPAGIDGRPESPVPFAIGGSEFVFIDHAAVFPVTGSPPAWEMTTSINDQGWMVVSPAHGSGDSYLRVPSTSNLHSATSYRISCSNQQSARALKVNRNGLILGSCNAFNPISGPIEKPAAWAWWNLGNPVDLIAFLPEYIDLGFGLIPRDEQVFSGCETINMADNADVILMACRPSLASGSRYRMIGFVLSPSGSRQLMSPTVNWVDVNALGCAVGNLIGDKDSGVIDCGKTMGATQLSALNGGTPIAQVYDINDRGDILVSTGFDYVVLTPR